MTKTILTYKVPFDGDVFVAIVEVKYHVDGNWAADADGNRGAPRTFVDDVHIEEVLLDGSVLLPAGISPALRSKILALVDENL